MLQVYAYKSCSSCRSATKWLQAKGITFEEKAIRETPPTQAELRHVLKLKSGSLFNTSGTDYRELGIKDKLPTASVDEALAWLAANGNLIKRPFVVDIQQDIGLVGFKESEWQSLLC
jgi:arsenate reductase (glutaredoxin)